MNVERCALQSVREALLGQRRWFAFFAALQCLAALSLFAVTPVDGSLAGAASPGVMVDDSSDLDPTTELDASDVPLLSAGQWPAAMDMGPAHTGFAVVAEAHAQAVRWRGTPVRGPPPVTLPSS
ncbi:MAG: hypothetical protein V2I63_06400 [Pseudomonadales bacterium]|jgi:hypothetical protein|nr:hypothetical protein [Pseudomonadales bacterium]